jgi:hypothetical protein
MSERRIALKPIFFILGDAAVRPFEDPICMADCQATQLGRSEALIVGPQIDCFGRLRPVPAANPERPLSVG